MIVKAHAKVNIFLKIVGLRGEYHLLSSRFMQLPHLFDTLRFLPKEVPSETFTLRGDFGCETEKNTIYKAYLALLKHTGSRKMETFFHTHEVVVDKQIPEFAGLGGGSSDAAAFLNLCNELFGLGLRRETVASIGASIGADVPFFVYDYPSANVSGIGEIVEPFEEVPLDLITVTPEIACDTGAVYAAFRKGYLHTLARNRESAERFSRMQSDILLEDYSATALNDLFAPALSLCPELQEYAKKGWFFSGSGSTFFKRREA
ncbi:MAG TPA: 4-(cytidine 5'-diphospho)-2-C-methyl-D-erythritol kinase [Campylobacteraceae bacterium]|nr:4-(cytidine 5'-diphospho)-2-C-methyl-D-erythritol kinase [Campylobacteraceae bacterium]